MKLLDTYEIKRDNYGWTMFETYPGHDRQGNPKLSTRTFFYGSLEQAVKDILEFELAKGDAKSVDEILELLRQLPGKIVESLSQN